MKWQTLLPEVVRTAPGFLFLALVLANAGCSDNQRLTIKGSVSYQGQPVKTGIVKIYGPGDRLAMAYLRDGTFHITEVTPGEIKVTVEPDSSEGQAVAIPKKYADPKTTNLVFTITSSMRELPIELN
jgi:hypothetical protein